MLVGIRCIYPLIKGSISVDINRVVVCRIEVHADYVVNSRFNFPGRPCTRSQRFGQIICCDLDILRTPGSAYIIVFAKSASVAIAHATIRKEIIVGYALQNCIILVYFSLYKDSSAVRKTKFCTIEI